MTALWIAMGIAALILLAAVAFYGYRIGMFVVIAVLAIFSRVVMERKFVEKFIMWNMERNEDRTMLALAVFGWGIVIGTVAAIGAAIALPFYFFPRFV